MSDDIHIYSGPFKSHLSSYEESQQTYNEEAWTASTQRTSPKKNVETTNCIKHTIRFLPLDDDDEIEVKSIIMPNPLSFPFQEVQHKDRIYNKIRNINTRDDLMLDLQQNQHTKSHPQKESVTQTHIPTMDIPLTQTRMKETW
jgi:hypothetical protein